MPNSLTYCGSCNRYLIGVAINNNRIYETPSKRATSLNIFNEENICVNFCAKVVHTAIITVRFKFFL